VEKIEKEDKILKSYEPGDIFGEVFLLY